MRFSRRDFVATALLLPAPAGAQSVPRVIEAREGKLKLLGSADTAIWGFDGATPGPLLRIRKGEALNLRLVNRLAQPTAIHWHGVRIPNAMDGVPGLTQQPVAPGGAFDIRFTPPDAGTFFYRSSAWPEAAEQKGRGLYGALIVDEEAPPAVEQDVLLMLDDWRLDADGAHAGAFLDPADVRGEGRIGGTITFNSAQAPQVMTFAPNARVRLRLLNACNARMAGFIFDGVTPLVIAVDGQPCDAFNPIRNLVPAGPGARFDVLFDMPPQAGEEARVSLRGGGLKADAQGEPDRPVITFRCDGAPLAPRAAPAGLPANPKLPAEIRLRNARRLDLTIEASALKEPRQAWTINGAPGAPQMKPLFTVARGQPVSLGFFNKTDVAQTLHVHGHHFRILHLLDDGWEPYWRDCVIIPPGRHARIAFVADNPGKWLIESSILEHAVSGVAAVFEVR